MIALIAGLAALACGGAESPPPDAGPGRLIFTRTGNSLRDLYTIDVSSREVQQLTTHLALDDWAAWSPDTFKVLFQSDRIADTTVFPVFQIWVMNSDGSSLNRLTDEDSADSFHPAWSPNGSRIVFASNRPHQRDGNGDIYLMDPNGANVVQLTTDTAEDGQPAWSPDGGRIAFATDRDGNAEIYVMDTTGASLVNLTNNASVDFAPQWSPDGTKIAFQSNREIQSAVWVMNADGSNPVRLTGAGVPAGAPNWSPDGTRIAFEQGGDLWIMNADGSNQIRITGTFHTDGLPRWRPIL